MKDFKDYLSIVLLVLSQKCGSYIANSNNSKNFEALFKLRPY